ncbi:HNH endonuclease [Streptomyces sp. TBY4]|uniref:HNH endonuclease n=1 Tax=Streptomyces sp. TBY4 TaxID=2962030 RepID=UPI0020B689F9|nr:HNH endonuclease signature motif containing protein [Streptomyces sp. TBY4]MCP3757030.1 HNH endonuclease [Streptomyces sp. TBY4]
MSEPPKSKEARPPAGTRFGRFRVTAHPISDTDEPPAPRPAAERTMGVPERKLPAELRYALEVRYRRRGQRVPVGAVLQLTLREQLMLRLYRLAKRHLESGTPVERAERRELIQQILDRRVESRTAAAAMTDEERKAAHAEGLAALPEERAEAERDRAARREGRKRGNGLSAPYSLAGIYERDAGTCAWCLGPVDLSHRRPDPRAAQLDHLQALQDGGADHPDNIALVHAFCNNSRSACLVVPPDFARYWLAQRVQRGRRSVSYSSLTQDHINLWEDARDWTHREEPRL